MAERHSLWAWIGIGCAGLFVVGVVVVVGGGYVLYREAREFSSEMEDPQARTANALEVLGADSLPVGYHAVTGLALPFGVLRLAILSDQPPGPQGQPDFEGGRGLIYVESIFSGQDERGLADYFEGRSSDASVLRRNHINVDVDEILGRGVIDLGGEARALYLTQRGSVSSHGQSGRGLMALVYVDCPQDERLRVAIWFSPDVVASAESSTVGPTALAHSLAGTAADPEALADFLEPFELCPGPASKAQA